MKRALPQPETATRTVCAQTNLQLFNQLQRQGCSNAELTLIHAAYELAKDLFAGYFIASGRTQIAHVVGTASILVSLHLPAEVVAAGLIHNVYENGDFGDGRRGISEARRRRTRQAVGANVEEYVYRYPAIRRAAISLSTRLSAQTVSALCGPPDNLDPVDRRVLLIVLAEQLDHHQNFEHMEQNNCLNAEIAEQLGFPALAAELRAAFSEAVSAKFRMAFAGKGLNRSQVIAPRSYRRRVLLRYEQIRIRERFRQLVHRVSSLCSSVSIGTRH